MQGKFCVTEAFVSVLYFQIFQIVKQFNKGKLKSREEMGSCDFDLA
jgi:hypothetical protein